MAGADADFHRRDLFEAIARGDHPSWTLSVQVMPYAEARSYRINPFDLTKTWPHKRLSADQGRHDDAEPQSGELLRRRSSRPPSRRATRCPGIGLSPDKMLLGRAFAYNDAQRNRIGTNFHQLPVNQPKVPVNTYMFDGQMAYHHSGNRAGVRAEQRRPALGGRDRPRRGRMGGGRRDGAQRLHAACRGRRLHAARHPGARGLQRRPARRARRHRSRAACSAACASRCSARAFEYWKKHRCRDGPSNRGEGARRRGAEAGRRHGGALKGPDGPP